jgi:hypothetical protein
MIELIIILAIFGVPAVFWGAVLAVNILLDWVAND